MIEVMKEFFLLISLFCETLGKCVFKESEKFTVTLKLDSGFRKISVVESSCVIKIRARVPFSHSM